MTAARQQKKRNKVLLVTAAACCLLGARYAALPSGAATSERIVTDWHTGLAIDGFDPVAFYTDGEPLLGSPELEAQYDSAIWRFRNVGNRAAFTANPDTYMPQFGGYDPVEIAKGVAVAGNPTIWIIRDKRLFLFYDSDRLAAFRADADRLVATADRRWPDVVRSLSP